MSDKEDSEREEKGTNLDGEARKQFKPNQSMVEATYLPHFEHFYRIAAPIVRRDA